MHCINIVNLNNSIEPVVPLLHLVVTPTDEVIAIHKKTSIHIVE